MTTLGMMLAAALLQTASPVAPQPQTATPAPGSANEVVCQNRAVTGSRFTGNRCETRRQRAQARAAAQRYMQENRPGPSTDGALNSGPATGPGGG